MSFSTYDAGRSTGRIAELYLFTFGAGPSDFHAFTDHDRIISFGGVDYEPVPIDRGRVGADGGRERRDLTIQMANDNPVVSMFLIYPPDSAISVIIRQGHFDDPDSDYVPVWSGRISNVKWGSDFVAEVVCRPLSAASRQGGLRRHWQLGCPHVLFGSQCLAAEAPATVTTSASGVVANKITLAGGWNTQPVEKYIGGKVTWSVGVNPTRRSILRIEADLRTVVLSGPAIGLEVGEAVQVSLGCNRTMDDCINLHDNIHNFGGDPWIPLENPVNTNPYV